MIGSNFFRFCTNQLRRRIQTRVSRTKMLFYFQTYTIFLLLFTLSGLNFISTSDNVCSHSFCFQLLNRLDMLEEAFRRTVKILSADQGISTLKKIKTLKNDEVINMILFSENRTNSSTLSDFKKWISPNPQPQPSYDKENTKRSNRQKVSTFYISVILKLMNFPDYLQR